MEAKEQRTYSSLARGRRERGRDGGASERDGEREAEREREREREMERERERETEGYGERRHASASSAVLTQKSYSSSETLRALEHTEPSAHTLYPPRHRMPDMVPRDREAYRGTGEYQAGVHQQAGAQH